jgi:hypothetical protein
MDTAHILVAGLGQFGEAVVVQAARQWHDTGSPGGRLRITAVDQAAGHQVESLMARYPWLPQVCELIPVEVTFESREFTEAGFLFDETGGLKVSAIYICVDDDSRGLSAAFALHRHVKRQEIPVVVRMVHGAGLATLFHEEGLAEGEYAGLHAVGMLDRMCDPGLLFAGVYEILARAIHEEYRRNQEKRQKKEGEEGEEKAEGADEADSAAVPWDDLPETLRESNRDQAAHIGVKLERVGCDLAPLTDLEAASFAFRDDRPNEVEILAEMEHERWVTERVRGGWKLGELDRPRKRSPYLVPWSDLPEDIKEYDRVFIRGMPRFLASAGFQIMRHEAPADVRDPEVIREPS